MAKKLFKVGDLVKLVESPYKQNLGLTYTICSITNTECQIEDINGNREWVEYDKIEMYREGFDPESYFGLNQKIADARKECEKKILEAVCEFGQRTGLRVTNIIYNYYDCLDGNVREQSISIEAKI